MATLKDFKARIEAGGAACRIDRRANESALIFMLDGSFYVSNSELGNAAECLSWAEVLTELGDWAQYGGWQPYILNREARR